MGTFILFIVIGLILFLVLKKFSPDMLDEHSRKRNDSTKRIIEAEHEKARLYDERKRHGAPLIIEKTQEEWLEEEIRLDSSFITVDAELIFTHANFQNNYYLRATHYFPCSERVYGTNANGVIDSVDLYHHKEATHPKTGERIKGIKRYLRQNAVK